MHIGLGGTGRMGAAMGQRLLDLGHTLTVWNRTPQRAAGLCERGASPADRPADLVRDTDLVLLMLFDDAAVEAVYAGPAGLLSVPLEGRMILDMSTVRPDTAIDLARRVRERDGRFVECPVGGTVAPAREGALLGMAGGEPGDVADVLPVLEALCRRVEHVGPVGSGASMKLAINLPLIVYWEAVGEALNLSRAAEIPDALAADLLADSAGAIPMSRARLPAVVGRIAGEAAGPAHFALSASAKDLRLALDAARLRGLSAPVTRAASESYHLAVAAGWGEADFPLQAAWRVSTASSTGSGEPPEAGEEGDRVEDPGRIGDLVSALAAGELTAEALAGRYLRRIEAVDDEVRAFREVDADRVLAEARSLDRRRQRGLPLGPLHGIPLAVKDVIDVEGWATRCNSPLLRSRAPASADARVVADLRAAGALVLGKAHTTEFALMDPSPARNPQDLRHTPGGSSSGSAAAVAAGMAPAALGTQTVASVSRPAAYCGIAAFKPSSGALSTYGVTPLAPLFDTIGFFGYRVDDAVTLFEAACPPHLATLRAPVADVLDVVVLEDPVLERCAPEVRQALEGAANTLRVAGHTVSRRRASVDMAALYEVQGRCARFESARAHGHLLEEPAECVGAYLRAALVEGLAIDEATHVADRATLARARAMQFGDLVGVDAVLWPAAPRTAPRGLAWTGDPGLISPWTGLGGPVVTVRVGTDDAGLPIGALLLGAPGSDVAFGAVARRLAAVLETAAGLS